MPESIRSGGSMGDDRNDDHTNPVDLSVEAALELEELKQGERVDAPALNALFHFIRTPSPAFSGQSISMLADVRAYALFRDSLGGPSRTKAGNLEEFRDLIERYLNDLEMGVARRQEKKIEEAKRFCLALNTHMLAKQMTEVYSRRERTDARSFDHEPLL